jgi:hypothetical protein
MTWQKTSSNAPIEFLRCVLLYILHKMLGQCFIISQLIEGGYQKQSYIAFGIYCFVRGKNTGPCKIHSLPNDVMASSGLHGIDAIQIFFGHYKFIFIQNQSCITLFHYSVANCCFTRHWTVRILTMKLSVSFPPWRMLYNDIVLQKCLFNIVLHYTSHHWQLHLLLS